MKNCISDFWKNWKFSTISAVFFTVLRSLFLLNVVTLLFDSTAFYLVLPCSVLSCSVFCCPILRCYDLFYSEFLSSALLSLLMLYFAVWKSLLSHSTLFSIALLYSNLLWWRIEFSALEKIENTLLCCFLLPNWIIDNNIRLPINLLIIIVANRANNTLKQLLIIF